MRTLVLTVVVAAAVGAAGGAVAGEGALGNLRVEISQPAPGALLPESATSIEVEGGASVFGGVSQLDLFLVLDTSKSLQRTDPRNYRSAGAIALVRALPARSDIQLGVVDVDGDAELLLPLTRDRLAVEKTLRRLNQRGSTNIAAGIRTAVRGFAERARPGSSRVMLLFTDGKSDEDKARAAMYEAREEGIAVHSLLLGSDDEGEALLSEIAEKTGGSFVRVKDPAKLAEAFLNLRTTGVESVVVRVNGGPPVETQLVGGRFVARVPVSPGPNEVVALAKSLDGRVADARVTVVVSGPLRISIDSPLEGTVLESLDEGAVVTGRASVLDDVDSRLGLEHPDRGIESVSLRVGDAPETWPATLANGAFQGQVPLAPGENRIVATATTRDGRTADAVVTVNVRAGCGELEVSALRDGRPALSISERAVEIVVDASNSMWGRIGGAPKIAIAQETLHSVLDVLPDNLEVALRAYGHTTKREARNCTDSQLLVPFEGGNRGRIRAAVAGLKPRGQTPLGYSLEQVAADFGSFRGERAVVLLTDGIESCGGDPVAAARALQRGGSVPVHVIGFGLAAGADADAASLRAIASASGGRYIAAANAEELREALSVTVGTPFRVSSQGRPVAEGAIGSGEPIRLRGGAYTVRFESKPPRELPVEIATSEHLTVVLEQRGEKIYRKLDRKPAGYIACEGSAKPPILGREEDEVLIPPASPR